MRGHCKHGLRCCCKPQPEPIPKFRSETQHREAVSHCCTKLQVCPQASAALTASAQVPSPPAPAPCQAGHAQGPIQQRYIARFTDRPLSSSIFDFALGRQLRACRCQCNRFWFCFGPLTRSPSSDARSADTRTSAAAPSAMTEAFPAVTVPGWLLSPAATQSARSWSGLMPSEFSHGW